MKQFKHVALEWTTTVGVKEGPQYVIIGASFVLLKQTNNRNTYSFWKSSLNLIALNLLTDEIFITSG